MTSIAAIQDSTTTGSATNVLPLPGSPSKVSTNDDASKASSAGWRSVLANEIRAAISSGDEADGKKARAESLSVVVGEQAAVYSFDARGRSDAADEQYCRSNASTRLVPKAAPSTISRRHRVTKCK